MYLQIQNINKIFDNTDKESLRDISLEVAQGEFVCIVGPSGCGKSTLLNLVAGLISPTGGSILLEGKPVTEPGPDRVMMFQEAALFPWLSVRQNVMFALEAAGRSKAEQLSLSEQYLRMVQLWHYRDYPIHQISGGMKQRTALARALAMDSKLLLMDEPFSALDKQTIHVLREELEQIWEQTHKTILYVTHSVEEAIYFADYVVVMSENPGRIREIIPVTLKRPRHLENEAFVALRRQILQSVKDGVKKSIQAEFDDPEQEGTYEN